MLSCSGVSSSSGVISGYPSGSSCVLAWGGNRYVGYVVGVMILNGFIFIGEFIVFLIISLDLAGVAGLVILVQFIADYCACLTILRQHWNLS